MRLTELNPTWGRSFGNEELYNLSFDCVKCGKPYRVSICFHTGAAVAGIWKCTSPYLSIPPLIGVWPTLETLTLEPSIVYHTHGRKHPTCGWHITITNGEIIPA